MGFPVISQPVVDDKEATFLRVATYVVATMVTIFCVCMTILMVVGTYVAVQEMLR